MKKKYILAVIALFSVSLASQLTVQKVKIIGTTLTKEAVIRNLLPEAVEGYQVDSRNIDALVSKLESKLVRTQYFDKVLVTAMPSQKDPSKINIFIDLTEGITDRYDGGQYYGLYGKLNQNGEGKNIQVKAGINAFSAYFVDNNFSPDHTFVQASAGVDPYFYTNRLREDKIGQVLGVNLFWGKSIASNMQIGLGFEAYNAYLSDWTYQSQYIEPSLRFIYDSRDNSFNPSKGLRVDSKVGYLFGPELYRLSVDSTQFHSFFADQVVAATHISLAAQKGSINNDYF